MNTTPSKKLIPGLDVMKFIMAFLIVDIHVKGYLITPPIVQQYIIFPIEGLAVPEFFVISSFFVFQQNEKKRKSTTSAFPFLASIDFALSVLDSNMVTYNLNTKAISPLWIRRNTVVCQGLFLWKHF